VDRLIYIRDEIRYLRRQVRRARPISVPELTAQLEMLERAAELEIHEQALKERRRRQKLGEVVEPAERQRPAEAGRVDP
jgi:hypothetical protein